MRILAYSKNGTEGLAAFGVDAWRDLSATDPSLPADLAIVLQEADWRERLQRAYEKAPSMQIEGIQYRSPFKRSEKIVCVGLNYADHTAETTFEQPAYPTFFPRFSSTLIGHDEHIVKPRNSEQLDYEGELVAVVGTAARHVSEADALSRIAGYTVFNDASVRDYQFKSPQWTMGKNFDGTGACGPVFVTADELPPGARGLAICTRVNGKVEQAANTSELIFDVATLVSLASEVFTLRPGDLIVTGTPAGTGLGKKPPKYLKEGDVCEVEVEGVGLLRNVVRNEA